MKGMIEQEDGGGDGEEDGGRLEQDDREEDGGRGWSRMMGGRWREDGEDK